MPINRTDELQSRIEAIEEERRVDKKVSAIVKLRCASAYASILGFIAVIAGICTTFSDVLRDAAKAALKIIIARLMS